MCDGLGQNLFFKERSISRRGLLKADAIKCEQNTTFLYGIGRKWISQNPSRIR